MKIILFCFVLLFLLSSGGQAQKQYSFIRLGNEDGLVNNQVNCIYKDHQGFIWIGTVAGLSRYDGVSFVNFKHNTADSSSIDDNYIINIQEDFKHNLWLETSQGYEVYDVREERFYSDPNEYLEKDTSIINIDRVYCDNHQQIWLKDYNKEYYQLLDSATYELRSVFPDYSETGSYLVDFKHANGYLYCLFGNGTLECYDDSDIQLIFSDDYLDDKMEADSLNAELFIDAENDVWFYGNNLGTHHYNALTQQWSYYSMTSNKTQLTSNIIRRIVQDDKGLIWVGTDHGGIDIINKYSGEIQTIYHQPDNDKSVAQNSITDLYIDDNNIVWVGSYKNGFSYYHESIHKFPHFRHLWSDPHSIPFSDINCFVEDDKGNLWIGANGGGLIYFDRHNNRFTQYLHDKNDPYSLSGNVIVSLFIDVKGDVWAGTYAAGLNRFDGKKFTRYQCEIDGGRGLTNNNIWSIIEDNKQNLWVGTLGGGIVTYDRQTDQFKPLPNNGTIEPPGPFINQIFKLSDGNMFIATANGVAFYNVEEQRFKYHPTINRTEPFDLGNKAVNAVYEDTRGFLWIATREGLIMLDSQTDYIKHFTDNDGLPEDIINCIEEDEYQAIWISKSTGLSQIVVNKLVTNEYEFHIYDFTKEDGLQGNEFNPNASYKTSDNELIFGGANGFNLFKSKDIKYPNVLPKVVFTDLQVYNKTVVPGQKVHGRPLLNQSISLTDEVVLKHSMNVFSISFTALNFFIADKIRYQYRLHGFNEQWLPLEPAQKQVTYTNLNAGDYVFQVKASKADGSWNSQYSELRIEVLPPLYATTWAFLLYSLIILLAMIYYRYSMLRKERLKFEMEQEKLLINRNREMDEMKLKFLTNVSHEFRTPLTLILTPLHKLMNQATDKSNRKLLEVIDRNARQLLELVNQLLDFRKLELHGLKYNPSYGNIVAFLQEVSTNFEEAFTKKRISFTFTHDVDQFMLNFDRDKLQKVLMNLLSNALKFTPENGSVELSLQIDTNEELVYISVKDNGIGIKPSDMDKIFVRFFQSEHNKKLGLSGSGIGLNLAREMVQLHNGTIHVESKEGKGATFKVVLPVTREDGKLEETAVEVGVDDQEQPELHIDMKGKASILLVEDNHDFRTFMKETLEDRFNIYEAADGQAGIEMVHKVIPDLIISDVMMPRVDGLELCQNLRKDIRTSHIPIILLTARTADEDKIKGLEIGADDYITKPFNMDLLVLRLNKLLEKRSKMQKQFQKNVEIQPSEVQITSMDEKLISKAVAVVETNIAESSFSVEDLSKELGMSRVYLYKKLVSITGKSPIEFIRIIRLKRGAQLLQKSQMNISEIAYEVGFNSPRYFSKYFKEEYGMLPTAYMKSFNKEDNA
ncbi:response regulator [Carboxylicivirga sediminis]|uniref:histidine kinase n=1 Tax=Carboxylicivirga sediminis TaxID=2006564 RepID=A0A941IWY6_9BACT|nr:two-component regulator propeller domain-containing protein [Carboxylicivirga sediminis]MBR8534072.1 response regulator [Carboxylicivirga sediminis]